MLNTWPAVADDGVVSSAARTTVMTVRRVALDTDDDFSLTRFSSKSWCTAAPESTEDTGASGVVQTRIGGFTGADQR